MVRHTPRGKAVVFAPCKGFDVDLEENLQSLMRQDYDDYEVYFIVESLEDSACQTIKAVIEQFPEVSARLICAGVSVESGQKVHNLRMATADLPDDVEYLVFVDSDAQPRAEWLRVLVARLDGKNLSVTTGHRWFAPQRASLANLLVYSINSAMMVLLDRTGRRLIWGGSWAIRRDLFDGVDLRGQWRGTLSDDFVARRVLAETGEPTRFEPAAVVASPLEMRFGEMCSFIRRQYLIARFYSPGWWKFGLLVATLNALIWLTLVGGVVAALTTGAPSPGTAFSALAAVYLIGVFRAVIRQSLVATYFPRDARQYRAAQWFDILAGPIAALANWIAMLSSAVGDRIVWRGATYRMFLGGRIEFEAKHEALADEMAVGEAKQFRRAA